jgi:hypothetical protein
MQILERLSDSHGAALLGWVAPGVLYAHFEQTISAEVGARFALRFGSLIEDAQSVQYFADSSELASYDLVAMVAILDTILSKKDQFKVIVARPWSGALGPRARAFAAGLQCVEYVTSAAEFDARLRAAAPLADVRQFTVVHEPPPSGIRPAPLEAGNRTYVFDLSNFEAGAFTATRLPRVAAVPAGAWVCVARSDEQAFALAMRAAFVEWATPHQRLPEQFTVRFLDGSIG